MVDERHVLFLDEVLKFARVTSQHILICLFSSRSPKLQIYVFDQNFQHLSFWDIIPPYNIDVFSPVSEIGPIL